MLQKQNFCIAQQKLADLENAKAADDARVAATNAILQLGDREQAVRGQVRVALADGGATAIGSLADNN